MNQRGEGPKVLHRPLDKRSDEGLPREYTSIYPSAIFLVHGISRKIYTSHMLEVRFMGVESKEDSAGVTGRLSKEGG